MNKFPLWLIIGLFICATGYSLIDIQLDTYTENGLNVYTVAGTTFSMPYNRDKLCTLWTLASENYYQQCFGDYDCCSLSGADVFGDDWNEPLRLKPSSGYSRISAQVIYANYSLDGFPYSDIEYSNVATKSIPGSMSTQSGQKTLALNLYHGTQDTLNVRPLYPFNNTFFGLNDNVLVDYFVYHPLNTNVSCDLYLDNNIILSIQNSSYFDSVSSLLTLSQARHKLKLRCQNIDLTKESTETIIISDYDAPTISLDTNESYLSFADFVMLNFTAADNFADLLDCSVYVNNDAIENVSTRNGQKQSILVTNLQNGTYNWKVMCKDSIGNTNTSSVRKFTIDLGQNFSLALNQHNFLIGENGYYIITAPFGASTTILFTDPKGNSFFRYYNNVYYPLVGELNFSNYIGLYKIEAVLLYKGSAKVLKEQFTVSNSINARIYALKTEIAPNTDIKFEPIQEGGVSPFTYRWDFDDGTESTEKTPTHRFASTGTYDVKVTITDAYGNQATGLAAISVVNQRKLDIYVKSNRNDILSEVLVFVDGEKKSTDNNGKASYDVLEGNRKIVIYKDGYFSITDEISVTQDIAKTYYLNQTFIMNLNNTSESIPKQTDKTAGQDTSNPAGPNNKADPSNGDLITRITDMTDTISDALYSITVKDDLAIKAAEDLQIEEKLQDAKKDLLRYKRDADGLQFMKDEAQRKMRTEELAKNLDSINKETILDINVIKNEQYTSYPEDKSIEELFSEYLKDSKKDSKSQREIITTNIMLQKSIMISKDVKVIEITYLDGKKETNTLVAEKIQSKNLNRSILLERIPIDLAEEKDIEFTQKIMPVSADIKSLEMPADGKVVYLIKKEVQPLETKKIVTGLINPFAAQKKSGFSITGFAIFSSLNNIDDPMLVVQIGLIVILLLVYICYEFEVLQKLRRYEIVRKINPLTYVSLGLNKDMKQLKILLKKARLNIQNDKLDVAEKDYQEMIKIYNDKLGSDLRQKVIDEISLVYNDLLVHQIKTLSKDIEQVIANDKAHAKEIYQKMQELYTELPKNWKISVTADCKRSFELLTKR